MLLLMDSRGALMQKEINSLLIGKRPDITIKVEFVRGGDIKSITDKGNELLKNDTFDLCMLFAGINNTTRKKGKGCELYFNNVKSMVLEVSHELQRSYENLTKDCSQVVICHLIGMDIARYNKAPPSMFRTKQMIINEAIGQINININKMNIEHQVKGPWLDDTIHSATAKKVIHKYKKLADGLHPDIDTVRLWAKKVIASL